MKKLLCALIAALLLTGCLALAEEEPEVIDVPNVEIVQLEEGAVSVHPVGEAAGSADGDSAESPAITPEPDGMEVAFEDGFSLRFPDGWLYHPVDEEMAEKGVAYCLSDAGDEGWLYVQSWQSDCANVDALKALIDRTTNVQSSSIYAFNGTDFVVYDMTEEDVSCCAALMDDSILNLVFTPQSDADFMAVAAQILNTFELL